MARSSTGCKKTAMDQSADAALTVFAWGNSCRGDDAIGPLLAERLRSQARTGLRVVEDHQLNIEHVTDLQRDGAALFIDASVDIDDGIQLERIGPRWSRAKVKWGMSDKGR